MKLSKVKAKSLSMVIYNDLATELKRLIWENGEAIEKLVEHIMTNRCIKVLVGVYSRLNDPVNHYSKQEATVWVVGCWSLTINRGTTEAYCKNYIRAKIEGTLECDLMPLNIDDIRDVLIANDILNRCPNDVFDDTLEWYKDDLKSKFLKMLKQIHDEA